MNTLFKKIVSLLSFPIVHTYRTFKSKKSKLYKIFHILLSVFILLPLWLVVLWIACFNILPQLGLPLKPFQIIGDSQLPTLEDKSYLFTYSEKTWFGTYNPQRGDIVVFSNSKTLHDGKPSDFVKRVIGVGGDRIRIDGGDVYLNDQFLNEPYVLATHSTWVPKEFCKDYIVPNGFLFVMGDNRGFSSDSRDLGLISIKDVISYLPFSNQSGYKKIWSKNNQSTDLDISSFIHLVNLEREKANAPALTENTKLDKATVKRAEMMFKYDDPSYSATRSGYTMANAFYDAGFYDKGYYREFYLNDINMRADQLLDYFMKYDNLKEFILDKTYTQIGISDQKGKIYGCNADLKGFVLF